MTLNRSYQNCTLQIRRPYLIDGRLENVLLLIQVLGIHLNDDIVANDLNDLVGCKDHTLQATLEAHPEFFGRDSKDGNVYWHLVMRRTGDLCVHKTTQERLKPGASLPRNDLEANYRRPKLTASQVESLMKTAVELHARSIAAEDERRWWPKMWVPFLGSVLGGVLAACVAALTQIDLGSKQLNTNDNKSQVDKSAISPRPLLRGMQDLKSNFNSNSTSPAGADSASPLTSHGRDPIQKTLRD